MFVGWAPRLKELNQLLAGGVVIPFTVAAHDLEQLVEGFLPTAISVQRNGKVESRLVIERVGGNFLFQLSNGAKMSRLFGDFKGGTRRRNCGIVSFGLWDLCQSVFGLLDAAGFQI